MKRLTLIGIFVALLLAIVAIAATWSTVTPVNPAVAPDTSSTPNPARSAEMMRHDGPPGVPILIDRTR